MKNPLKNLFFWRPYTTGQNKKYWRNRGDPEYWLEYAKTWNHPHRFIIASYLRQIDWGSLFEVGCGSGPNIINLARLFRGKQLGGIDINKTAIKVLNGLAKGGLFKVGSGENIMMSDKSTDIVLSDAYLIYIDPRHIKKHLKEFKRIARKQIILREYHSFSWIERQKLRIFSGRHAYDYKKLLEQLGFYDVQIYKLPPVEADNEQKFRSLIVARTTLRV